MARKKLKIDASLCIGCGACVGTYPEDIQFNDNGQAELISGEAEEDALEICPVGAIQAE